MTSLHLKETRERRFKTLFTLSNETFFFLNKKIARGCRAPPTFWKRVGKKKKVYGSGIPHATLFFFLSAVGKLKSGRGCDARIGKGVWGQMGVLLKLATAATQGDQSKQLYPRWRKPKKKQNTASRASNRLPARIQTSFRWNFSWSQKRNNQKKKRKP